VKQLRHEMELNEVSVEERKVSRKDTSRINKWSNSTLIKRKDLEQSMTRIPETRKTYKPPVKTRERKAKGFVWLAVFVPLKSIDLLN